jgi:hypothetical protein
VSSSASHVSDGEAAAILEYMRRCLAVLIMPQWSPIIADHPADDLCNASIEAFERRWVARVEVPTDWEFKPVLVKRRTLFHETCHLLHARQERGLFDMLRDNSAISIDYEHLIFNTYRTDIEYLVDHITTVFERLGLFPEWPTNDDVAGMDIADSREYY